MKLLMISGDRSILQGKKSAFWYTLEEFAKHWERIDVIGPHVKFPIPNAQSPRNSQCPIPKFPNVVFHSSSWSLIFQTLWIMKKGKELIREYRHDVMTVHEYPPFYNGIGALWLSRKTSIPYALEIHHIVGSPLASSFTELMGRIASRVVLPPECRRSAAVRCVSRETVETLVRWGVSRKNMKIAPSFYLDHKMLASFDASSRDQKYDLACCGRLVKNKGFADVLKAVSLLPNVMLLIIGDGPEHNRLERLTKRLGITDRVTFTGWLPSNEDVYRAITSAKIFVMNSMSEGGPRIALEAMALGMLVIATKVGVMGDVIQDGVNGVFTNGTPGDLAAKVKKYLVSSSERERLGTEAKRILERFERKKLIREYVEFLAGMCTP